MAVKTSLTGTPGNPEEEAKIFTPRSLGNCLVCHAVEMLSHEQFHGNVARRLDDIRGRLSFEELRAIGADARQVFSEDSMMPGF